MHAFEKLFSTAFFKIREQKEDKQLFHLSLFVTNETCVNREQKSRQTCGFSFHTFQPKKKALFWPGAENKSFTFTNWLEVTIHVKHHIFIYYLFFKYF